jgi:hypothetical protein
VTADILVVSIGATAGWRGAARGLAGALADAGASVDLIEPGQVPEVRTFMLTDLVQAMAAAHLARRGAAGRAPRATIYCSMTAALLWPWPGAIWLDGLAAENRPGRHGIWQRQVERTRARQAPLLMTMAPGVLEPLAGRPRAQEVRVPVAVDSSGPPAAIRDLAAIAYAADPLKRRLDVILHAWTAARRPGETLTVCGIDPRRTRWRDAVPEGVQFVGPLAPDAYRALVRRARVFLAAPRREDFGIAPLEALADGAMLVTTPAPGPYPALELARRLDPRLVCRAADLPGGVRAALDAPRPDYAVRAGELVAPYRRSAVAATLAADVLPRLLPGSRR